MAIHAVALALPVLHRALRKSGKPVQPVTAGALHGRLVTFKLEGKGGMKTEMWTWMRVQFFRFWTALVVLGAYGYFWLNTPEYLTWWKRTVNTLIEKGCDMLSYPWGDRIESTVGNFGIWVQITLAILIFRTIIGTVLILIRATRRR